MKKWLFGGCLAGGIGLCACLAVPKTNPPAPHPQPTAPVAAAATPPAAPAPVVLAEVVDVMDLDPLLDPAPTRQDAGVVPASGVIVTDDEPARTPTAPASDPPPIPPADESDF